MDESKKDNGEFAPTMTPAEADAKDLEFAKTEAATKAPDDLALAKTHESGPMKIPNTWSERDKVGKFLILRQMLHLDGPFSNKYVLARSF